MRVALAIAITATFVLAAWWNNPTLANTKQTGVSINPIDPTVMTLSASDLPVWEYVVAY
jgi:hypothetical protein